MVSQVVGATGGSVALSDGTTVAIPAGALSADTTITIATASSAPSPSGATEVGTPYTFGPDGLKFLKPITVTLAYDPSKLPAGTSGSSLVIYTAPDGEATYSELPSSVADGTHISAVTTHGFDGRSRSADRGGRLVQQHQLSAAQFLLGEADDGV
jgi:hypothetical protein